MGQQESGFIVRKVSEDNRENTSYVDKLSRQELQLAGFEEFILLSIITFTEIHLNYYGLCQAAFMASWIHLFVPIIQWVRIRR